MMGVVLKGIWIFVLCQISTASIVSLQPPTFEKSSYRARIIDGSIEILDGPIRLLNCESSNAEIRVTADETKYYPIVNPPTPSELIQNCSVLFFAFVRPETEAEDILYDIITLEAIDDFFDYGVRTNLVIISSSAYDPYKMVYKVNGTEYVVLNYAYFKLFLLIIAVTGILLLVLEIREVVLKYRNKHRACSPVLYAKMQT